MFPSRPKIPFGGDISLTYVRNIYKSELGSRGGGGVGGGHIFITSLMKHIQFCILTRNEKENSSQIYQICALTVFIISHQCCVLVIVMQEIFPKGKGS